MMTITESLAIARKIQRKDRLAQGFSKLRLCADHIRTIRNIREMRQRKTDSLITAQKTICVRLLQSLNADKNLKLRCRREACGSRIGWTPPLKIVWGNAPTIITGARYEKYHWHNCGAGGTVYRHSTRTITVSAAHAWGMLK